MLWTIRVILIDPVHRDCWNPLARQKWHFECTTDQIVEPWDLGNSSGCRHILLATSFLNDLITSRLQLNNYRRIIISCQCHRFIPFSRICVCLSLVFQSSSSLYCISFKCIVLVCPIQPEHFIILFYMYYYYYLKHINQLLVSLM